MCGIFAYVGKGHVSNTLLHGLKRLEYRGYDSAGISTVVDSKVISTKVKGKVSNLSNRAGEYDEIFSNAGFGISHTRWATHGEPNEVNAHPHIDSFGEISIVHNGIIENYGSIKKKLTTAGHNFVSETDTEVLANLISFHYRKKKSKNLEVAVKSALQEVVGTYGVAVISKNEPGVIIGARSGSPLIVGVSQNDFFLSSDAAAIVSHTKDVIYLEDGDVVRMDKNGPRITTLFDESKPNQMSVLEFDLEMIEKNGFDHFMLKEIYEQTETIKNAYRGRINAQEGSVKLDGLGLDITELEKVRRIVITACGTSWHAAMVGEYLIENLAGIPVEVDYASEFTHRKCLIENDTLFFVISQSGETLDTLAAMKEVKALGHKTYGLVNVVGSTIARETNAGIYLHAGPEIGVASTKAFTSQVTVLFMIAMLFSKTRGLPKQKCVDYLTALTEIPNQIKEILSRVDEIKKLAQTFKNTNNSLYLGRSYNFPVALEGALKLKEISYIHAEGYPAAEMKHGPIALIDENMPVVFVATESVTYSKVISNIKEVKARKGVVLAIANDQDQEIHKHCDYVIYVPKTIEYLSPILNVIPLQLLSYYVAIDRGCDVDQPRNLAKSVTVE